MRVTIMGAGLMGTQIGVEYALGGHDVVLVARDVDAVGRRLDAARDLLDREQLAAPDAIGAALERTSVANGLDGDALRCDLAVESLPEQLEIKADFLGRVAEASPEAILASNTSSIPISRLGEATGAPERVIGTHYLNPPLLMPTVEVICAPATLPSIAEHVVAELESLGKLPIVVRNDVPGFIWNRLQFALVRECAWLVENGVASPEDIDTVMREGLARRWRRVGPLRAIALGGIDTWNRSGRNIVPELASASSLPELADVAITNGDLAADVAARDAALARELREERKGAT